MSRGWGLISANFNAPWSLGTHWQAYAAAASSAGRRADPSLWRVARTVLVTESDAEAADYLATDGNAVIDYYSYMFRQFQRINNMRVFLTTPDAAVEDVSLAAAVNSMVIAGSPGTVTDRLVALVDEIGPFGGLLMAFHEWDDRQLVADIDAPSCREASCPPSRPMPRPGKGNEEIASSAERGSRP